MPHLNQYKEALLGRPMTRSDSLSEAPGSWVCVRGTVASELPIAAGFARIQAEGSPAQIHYFTPDFTLKLASGQSIQIKTAGEVSFLPERKTRADWGELEAEEVYRPLAKRAPGPHIKVSAAHSILRPGDVVEVFGQLEDDTSKASYRSHGRLISASSISSGEHSTKLMDSWYAALQAQLSEQPQTPLLSTKRVVRGLLLLLGLLVAYRVFTFLPSALATLSAFFGAWFYIEFWSSKEMPPFYCYQPQNTAEVSKASWLATALFLLAFFPTLVPGLFITGFGSFGMNVVYLFSGTMNQHELIELKQLTAGLCCVIFASALSQTISMSLSRSAWMKFAELFLRAKPYDPNNPDAWASISGVLRDTSPVEICGRECAIYFLERTTRTSKNKSTYSVSTSEQISRESFFLDTPHGAIEIDPQDAIWSSTSTAEKIFSPDEKQSITHKARLLLQRDFVVAVGRVQGQKMASTGPQSLLLFGDSNNAIAALEEMITSNKQSLLRMSALALLLGLIAAIALSNLL